MWSIFQRFNEIRTNDAVLPVIPERRPEFDRFEKELFNSKNQCITEMTRAMSVQRLHAAFRCPQNFAKKLGVSINSFTNVDIFLKLEFYHFQSMPDKIIKFSPEYEQSLVMFLVVISPFAPHFASELWSKFISVPNRIDESEKRIEWSKDVLEQKWPKVDGNFEVQFHILVHGEVVDASITYAFDALDELTKDVALDRALQLDVVQKHAKGEGLKEFQFTRFGAYIAIDLTFDYNEIKDKKQKDDDGNEDDVIRQK